MPIKPLPAADHEAGGPGAAQAAPVFPASTSCVKIRIAPALSAATAVAKTRRRRSRPRLKWLDANQSDDGRWNPRHLEAGREIMVNGHDRSGAGSRADTGITGLVLLAFLASGHTHLHGPHQETVRRGLEFLLGQQDADGSVVGNATLYEKMYCHAMATCA